jgi:predicted TIM-barrel fold metal-dependent hydrolase
MEIIDAQVHFGPDWLEELIAIMNALGIHGAVLDEYWGYNAPGPGFLLPNGARRLTSPSSEIAFSKHPDRFTYVQRIDVGDPRLPEVVKLLSEAPGAHAVRVTPGLTETELDDFSQGLYGKAFELATDADLTIFVMIQGHVHLLSPYLSQFPQGRFVIDHCGMPLEPGLRRPGSSIKLTVDPGPNYEYFEEVLKMAAWPNVALKWAHAQGIFGEATFPFEGLTRFLRQAIDAFGSERVMWASDATTIKDNTWGDLLYCIKASRHFSDTEKRWLLGKSARQWLCWD